MKQSDRIAKLEKEIDFLKDHITNLHRTFVALVGGNRVQLQQDAGRGSEEQTSPKNEPGTNATAPSATESSPQVTSSRPNPAIRRRGAL